MESINCPECGTRAWEISATWDGGAPRVEAICGWCRHRWSFTATEAELEAMNIQVERPRGPVYTIKAWRPQANPECWAASITAEDGTNVQATGSSPRNAVDAAFGLIDTL